MRLTNHYLGPHSPPGTVRPLPVARPAAPKASRMTAAESRATWSLGNAWRYAKALASVAFRGEAPASVRLARAKACMGCPHRRTKPGSAEPIGWCGACGCGGGSRAALSRKITMPAATCPKGRWPNHP